MFQSYVHCEVAVAIFQMSDRHIVTAQSFECNTVSTKKRSLEEAEMVEILSEKGTDLAVALETPKKKSKWDIEERDAQIRRFMCYTTFPADLKEETVMARVKRRTGTGLPWSELLELVTLYHQQRTVNHEVEEDLPFDEQEDAFFREINELSSLCLQDALLKPHP